MDLHYYLYRICQKSPANLIHVKLNVDINNNNIASDTCAVVSSSGRGVRFVVCHVRLADSVPFSDALVDVVCVTAEGSYVHAHILRTDRISTGNYVACTSRGPRTALGTR